MKLIILIALALLLVSAEAKYSPSLELAEDANITFSGTGALRSPNGDSTARMATYGAYTAIIWQADGNIYAQLNNGSLIAKETLGIDDDGVIQAAINSVAALGRGTVYIMGGTSNYLPDHMINLSTNVSIFGIGYPVLNCSNNPYNNSTIQGDCIYFQNSGSQNIVIEGLVIENAKRVAIIGSGTNIVLRNNHIANFGLQGMNLYGTGIQFLNNYVDGCNIAGQEWGIVFGGYTLGGLAQGNIVRRCKGTGSSFFGGIEIGYSGRNIIISGNSVRNCASGIVISGHPGTTGYNYLENSLIQGNVVEACDYGIAVKNGDANEFYIRNPAIIGNNIYNTTYSGIVASGDSTYNLVNISIIGNTIDVVAKNGASGGGIQLSNSLKPVIRDNTIKNSYVHGLYIQQDNVTLVNNLVDTCVYEALNLPTSNTFSNVVVDGLRCLNVGRDAIRNLHTNNYGNVRGVRGTLSAGGDLFSEFGGQATIASGTASIAVTHGIRLQTTATYVPKWFIATGSTADTNALYIDTISATQFTVHSAGNVGGNRVIYWKGGLAYSA